MRHESFTSTQTGAGDELTSRATFEAALIRALQLLNATEACLRHRNCRLTSCLEGAKVDVILVRLTVDHCLVRLLLKVLAAVDVFLAASTILRAKDQLKEAELLDACRRVVGVINHGLGRHQDDGFTKSSIQKEVLILH